MMITEEHSIIIIGILNPSTLMNSRRSSVVVVAMVMVMVIMVVMVIMAVILGIITMIMDIDSNKIRDIHSRMNMNKGGTSEDNMGITMDMAIEMVIGIGIRRITSITTRDRNLIKTHITMETRETIDYNYIDCQCWS